MSVAEETGLRLALSGTQEDRFCNDVALLKVSGKVPIPGLLSKVENKIRYFKIVKWQASFYLPYLEINPTHQEHPK